MHPRLGYLLLPIGYSWLRPCHSASIASLRFNRTFFKRTSEACSQCGLDLEIDLAYGNRNPP
jgi:hypothetical protein